MPRKDGEIWIKHYSSKHKILLVGEGDFSFAACLAQAFGSAVNIVATSLDSKEELMMKHGTTAPANLKQLYQLGCTVIHNIDATSITMNRHRRLRARLFDRIVYNFPHAGLFYPENNYDQIELHKDVVRGFMRNARDLLADDGEVHVTHKTTHPFTKWGIEELAEEAGLELVDKLNFCRWDYPGYINKRGYGRKSNKTFRVGECSTFIFGAHTSVHYNASGMLRPSGEIHVNHKTTAPFFYWNLKDLASQNSLQLIERIDFKIKDYPGYDNKRGAGSRCDDPFPLGENSIFKFTFSPTAKITSRSRRNLGSPYGNCHQLWTLAPQQPNLVACAQPSVNPAMSMDCMPGYV